MTNVLWYITFHQNSEKKPRKQTRLRQLITTIQSALEIKAVYFKYKFKIQKLNFYLTIIL